MFTNDTIILDGGMGRELQRIGAPFRQPGWSATTLIEAPEMVVMAHNNFIKAGAQVITTNSYAVVPHHIGEDMYAQDGERLIALAAQIARQSADETGFAVKVAGCIPPVFGSYNAEAFDAEKAPDLLRPFFESQYPFVDLWLAETIGSLEEAQVIMEMHEQMGGGKPLWIAFSLSERCDEYPRPVIRSKEDVQNVISALADDLRCPHAILFNCCEIEDILPALEVTHNVLGPDTHVHTGAYANSFKPIDKKREATVTSELREDVTPEYYLDHAKSWSAAGASILGGCCGISPTHIKALADHFTA